MSILLAIFLAAAPARLTVTLPNAKGAGPLICSLFSSAAGFPGKSPLEKGNVTAVRVEGTFTCTFEELPAGPFAVVVIDDANSNGTLDKNFLKVPTEGYGFSNDPGTTFGPPRFEAARFELGAGEAKHLTITMKY
jgi:uncharacterized protein (DUF2141 family)